MGQPLEEIEGTEEERDNIMAKRLREASEGTQQDQKMALILKISHIGGHKYAGMFSMSHTTRDLATSYIHLWGLPRQCHHIHTTRSKSWNRGMVRARKSP